MSAAFATAFTKEDALQSFWSSFGIAARDENTVPETKIAMERYGGHYITYNAPTASIGETVPLYGNLWYKDYSWEAITEKVNEITRYIGLDGRRIPFDGGVLWLVRGVPFAQRMADEDDTIRHIYLNLTAEYISAN